jgi:tetratricopeptide (TPR) repeat protein
MEFAWKDTLTGDFFYSNNMNLEYYSVLYNLGVVYSLLGRATDITNPDLEESKHKDAIKYFQYAAGIFDKIKQELPNCLPTKEICPDLSETNLFV